jgi:hypothetical protein
MEAVTCKIIFAFWKPYLSTAYNFSVFTRSRSTSIADDWTNFALRLCSFCPYINYTALAIRRMRGNNFLEDAANLV